MSGTNGLCVCGKPGFPLKGGGFMCADCNYKFTLAWSMQLDQQARLLNFLGEAMEMTAGVYGIAPRYPLPKPAQSYVQNAPVNLIRIDRSTVGVVNTAQVNRIEATVNALSETGHSDVAARLAKFVEAVNQSQELDQARKTQVLDLLAAVSAAATLKVPKSVVSPMFDAISTGIQTAAALVGLWKDLLPQIVGLLGAS